MAHMHKALVNQGQLPTIWLAGKFTESVFKKKFRRRHIEAIDLAEACRDTEELWESGDLHLFITLAWGMTKILSYCERYYKCDLIKLYKDSRPKIPTVNEPSDDETNHNSYNQVPPGVRVSFNEEFPEDVNLLREERHTVQPDGFPELDTGFGLISGSMSGLTSIIQDLTLESEFNDQVRRLPDQTIGHNLTTGLDITPSKRRQADESDTPSKRQRRSRNLFNENQSIDPAFDTQPVPMDFEASVPLVPEPEHIPSPEQAVPRTPSPPAQEQNASIYDPPAQNNDQDSLQELAELDLNAVVPRGRPGRRNVRIRDVEIAIRPDVLMRNQRVNIYTRSKAQDLVNIRLYRQTVDRLLSLPSTAWSRKSFHRPAAELLANFQAMIVFPRINNHNNHNDAPRPGSAHPSAQLSDSIPARRPSNRRQDTPTPSPPGINDNTYILSPTNEPMDIEPPVNNSSPDVPIPDVDSNVQNSPPNIDIPDATLDAGTANLTPMRESDSDWSQWIPVIRKSSQSASAHDNIVDIDDIASPESSTSNPSETSLNDQDVRAQIDIYLSDHPIVTFDILVPPETHSRVDAVHWLIVLTKMAAAKEISLDQTELDKFPSISRA